MSGLSTVAKGAGKLLVETKSVLEEALGNMPNQAMSPDQLKQSLKNKSVQSIEMKQSGIDNLLVEDKVKPTEVLEQVKQSRPDAYEIRQIQGELRSVNDGSLESAFDKVGLNGDDIADFIAGEVELGDIVEMAHRVHGIEAAQQFEAAVTRSLTTSTLPADEQVVAAIAKRYDLQHENITANDMDDLLEQLDYKHGELDDDEHVQLVKDIDEIIRIRDTLPEEGSFRMFPAGSFRNTSLLDTDDATYSVNLYKNKSVDRKGLDSRVSHWQDEEDYVFHTRTDSPQPGVHRIQEIQSDVQNNLTSLKAIELEELQQAHKELGSIDPPSAKNYSLDIPYIKHGLQFEIKKAIEEGQQEVWLTVRPDEDSWRELARGVGVQKQYETSFSKTFKSLAKRIGAEVRDEDGYLKLVLPAAGLVTLPAYADSQTQDFRVSALEQGYSEAEIDAYLEENPIEEQEPATFREAALANGFSEQEVDLYENELFVQSLDPSQFAEPSSLIESDIPTATGDAQFVSLADEDVKARAIKLGVDPTTNSGIDAVYEDAITNANPVKAKADEERATKFIREELAALTELYDYDKPFAWLKAQLGFDGAKAAYEQANAEIRANVIREGKERGYDFVYGPEGAPDEWFINVEGKMHKVTPHFLESLNHFKGEIAGGVSAAISMGQMTEGLNATPASRLARLGLISSAGIAGAMLGDQTDYALAAASQNEEMTWEVAKSKLLGSGQAAVLGEVGGLAVFKLLKTSYKYTNQAYQMIKDQNIDGAFKLLKETTDLTDDEISEVVTRWKILNDFPVDQPLRNSAGKALRPEEEALSVLPVTRAGGDEIVAATTQIDARASVAVARQVNRRAQDLLNATGEASGRLNANGIEVISGADGLTEEIQKNMLDYVNETKAWYDVVKTQGSAHAGDSYNFNLHRTAIQPILEDIQSSIFDPMQAERAANMINRVNILTETRSFEDLIELRQLVNDFSGRGKPSHKTIQAFKSVLNNIDTEIDDVASKFDDGGVWKSDWEAAKAGYSEMKTITGNKLSKAINAEGAGEQEIARALVRFGRAVDGTYTDYVAKLKPKTLAKVESSIIDELVNKGTVGTEGEFRAIKFPVVAKQLRSYDFQTPDAKALKNIINQMSEVYQNDVGLAYASGGIRSEQMPTYLSTSVQARLHFALMNKIFRYGFQIIPGNNADAIAMVSHAGRLLEDPLDVKSVKQAIAIAKKHGDATELQEAITALQKQTAADKAAGRSGTTRLKMYKDKSGKLTTIADDTTKETDQVPLHRVASELTVEKLLGERDLAKLSDFDKTRLINEGFTTIALEDGSVIQLVR